VSSSIGLSFSQLATRSARSETPTASPSLLEVVNDEPPPLIAEHLERFVARERLVAVVTSARPTLPTIA
jgi:hypothetical protein